MSSNLFVKSEKIYPSNVDGFYRRLKNRITFSLLAFFYILPWVRWDRGGGAADQAVLFDISGQRAYFFSIEIWPQEIYYITGILVFSAVGLFFITCLFGRVWCGYTCPQTVWTDIFLLVEKVIQGDRNARIKLDSSQLNFTKLWKKITTHIIWLVISFLTGLGFVFFFNDAPTLFEQIISFDVPFNTVAWIAGITASTYIMAGFAREQVCIYMCPYARFQSAMFDKDTLIVAYDEKRGEPRGKNTDGHCIDCSRCVSVCPTGIDIRDGLQMECIACALCADACNDVMKKIALPPDLIGYNTEKGAVNLIRPRAIYYMVILALAAGTMLYSLTIRPQAEIHVLHDRNPLSTTLSDGSIRNGYTIKILNKSHVDKIYKLQFSGIDNAKMTVEKDLTVSADAVGHFHIFVSGTPVMKNTIVEFTLMSDKDKYVYESIFVR